MLEFEVGAVYENGVLKLETPLALKEGQKVHVVVHASAAARSAGLLEWKGDPKVLELIALDPEFALEAFWPEPPDTPNPCSPPPTGIQ